MNPWGTMSADEVAQAIAAPAMKAVEIIRRHDPAWGYSGQKNLFEVTITKRTTTVEVAKIKIAADDEEAAEKIANADKRNWWRLDFSEVGDDVEIYVEDVEELR
jgi:hypothetical protein